MDFAPRANNQGEQEARPQQAPVHPFLAPVRPFRDILRFSGPFLGYAMLWMPSTASIARQQSRVAAYRRAHNAPSCHRNPPRQVNMFRPHKFIELMKTEEQTCFHVETENIFLNAGLSVNFEP